MKHHINVVFDLDGTLVDSAPLVESILNKMRADIGLPPMQRKELLQSLSIGGVAMLQRALNTDYIHATSALERFRSRYKAMKAESHSLFPGVLSTLETLTKSGVTLSICTNKPRTLAVKVLQETGLLAYFAGICAGDDLPTRKPSVENILASIVSKNGIKPAVFLVGDSTVDQALAKNAAVPFFSSQAGMMTELRSSP